MKKKKKMKNEAKIKVLLKELHIEIRKYYEKELKQQRKPEAEVLKLTQYGSATFAWVPKYVEICNNIVEAHAIARLTVRNKTGDYIDIEAEVE